MGSRIYRFIFIVSLAAFLTRNALGNIGEAIFVADYGDEIYMADFSGDSLDSLAFSPLPFDSVLKPLAVDYDPDTHMVYWTESSGMIRRGNIDGTSQSVIISGLGNPEGIALNTKCGKVFWTDESHDRIMSANLNGSSQQVLIDTDIYGPRGIIVHPEEWVMFWTDWQGSPSKIERANLEGGHRYVIVNSDLQWPNGLAFNADGTRIYWCDAATDKIESTGLWGEDRMVHLATSSIHPFDLAVIDGRIVWTDWLYHAIGITSYDNSSSYSFYYNSVFLRPHGIHVYKELSSTTMTSVPFSGPQQNNSCQFSCCVNSNSPCFNDVCYCDDICSAYGDCCEDYFDVCPNPVNSTLPPPIEGPEWSYSCTSSCCLNFEMSCYDGCFCDDVCSWYGDCCEDYFDVCPNPIYATDIPDHITLSPVVGTMFGGTQVVIKGPGLNDTTGIICDFDGHYVKGRSLSPFSLLCVTPPIFKMGQVPLFISLNGGETFDIQAVFTVQTPEDAPIKVHPAASNAISKISQLNVTWDVDALDYVDTVDVVVYGYEEVNEQIHFEPVVTIAEDVDYDLGFYFCASLPAVLLQSDVGLIGVIESHNQTQNYTPAAQWGVVHVLEWLHGHNPQQWCSDWIEEDEGYGLEFLEVTPPCPCTLPQTFLDLARFSPHPDCDIDQTSMTNCQNKPAAIHCVRSNIPSVLGGAQECCYDSDGMIMNIALSDGGGYSYRYHHNGVPPYGSTGKVPYMSHFLADTLPWIYCCGYTNPNAIQNLCDTYKQLRPSQVCDNYSPPPPAIANGDPHIATLDSTMYTFNGHGEFTLLSTLDNEFVLQARTAPLTGVDATIFVAIAAKFGDSDVIHVQTNDRRVMNAYRRPADGSDFTFVDFDQAFRWTFEGVSLSGRNISSTGILVVFDGGVGMELKASEGAMSILLVAPDSFRGRTQGLMGMWNGDPSDDFLTPDNITLPANLSTEELHYQFGLQWEIEANESLLFYEAGTDHEAHTDRAYVPVFEPVRNRGLNQSLVIEVCGTNLFCIFDFQTTGSESFAQTSVKTFNQYEAALASSEIVSCSSLRAPANGNVIVSRYSEGGEASFTCEEGYNISHVISLTCQSNGEWSAGTIPTCLPVPLPSSASCPSLRAPANGNVIVSRYSEGGEAFFTCEVGYDISHVIILTCQSNGKWSDGTIPACLTPSAWSGLATWIIIVIAVCAGVVLLTVAVIVIMVTACYRNKKSKNESDGGPAEIHENPAYTGVSP